MYNEPTCTHHPPSTINAWKFHGTERRSNSNQNAVDIFYAVKKYPNNRKVCEVQTEYPYFHPFVNKPFSKDAVSVRAYRVTQCHNLMSDG